MKKYNRTCECSCNCTTFDTYAIIYDYMHTHIYLTEWKWQIKKIQINFKLHTQAIKMLVLHCLSFV